MENQELLVYTVKMINGVETETLVCDPNIISVDDIIELFSDFVERLKLASLMAQQPNSTSQ